MSPVGGLFAVVALPWKAAPTVPPAVVFLMMLRRSPDVTPTVALLLKSSFAPTGLDVVPSKLSMTNGVPTQVLFGPWSLVTVTESTMGRPATLVAPAVSRTCAWSAGCKHGR